MRILTYWEGCSIWVVGNNLEYQEGYRKLSQKLTVGTPNPAWMEGGKFGSMWQPTSRPAFNKCNQHLRVPGTSCWFVALGQCQLYP